MTEINTQLNKAFELAYQRLIEILKENNGFIDTQCFNKDVPSAYGNDTIFAFDMICDDAVERYVLGIRLNPNDAETEEVEVFLSPILHTRFLKVDNWDEVKDVYYDEEHIDGYWSSLRYSEVYFVQTLVSICEVIDEYV